MKMLEPLAKLLADSLASSDPKINDASFNAAWRAIALALFEYRRGNFTDVVDRLKQCSTYPNQAPSCAAISHVLLGMTWMHLGKTHEADAELALGRNLVENYFNKRLELSDDKSGKIQGWLTARVLLHEVEAASARQP